MSAPIPEDFRKEYETLCRWRDELTSDMGREAYRPCLEDTVNLGEWNIRIALIERIARLEAENARLKAPITEDEMEEYGHQEFLTTHLCLDIEEARELIAARAAGKETNDDHERDA